MARTKLKEPALIRLVIAVLVGELFLLFLPIESGRGPHAARTPETLRYSPVSHEVVESRLRKYPGNDKVRENTIKQLFADAGCDDDHLSEQAVQGSSLPNVICILTGRTDRVLIVGAHFDHVNEGDGVVDNWSGASLLPSLFEAVKKEPRDHSYIFVAFTDEEKGEIGSRFYAKQMTNAQIARTDAMVNMDTLGLAPTEFWASHSDKRLSGALAYIAGALKLPLTGVNVDQIGSTDSVQFSARKIPAITIHSLTQETWNARILHGPKDKISAMRLDDYYQTYTLLSAYIAYLDTIPPVAYNAPAR
jgi:hypothetical protein